MLQTPTVQMIIAVLKLWTGQDEESVSSQLKYDTLLF